MKTKVLITLFFMLFALTSCASPRQSMFAMTPQQMRLLQVRVRTYEAPENKVMAACVSTLQDLGYTISETSNALGLIVATKEEKSSDGGAYLAMGLAFSVWGNGDSGHTIISRTIHRQWRVMMHVRHAINSSVQVNITIQQTERITLKYLDGRHDQNVSYTTIENADAYKQFFVTLEKSLFLENNHVL